MLAQLERTDEAQISLTDPDSRAMAAHTKVGVGYNVQIAVDAKHKLIVEQAVTNQVVDMGLLTQTAEPARQVLGVETIDVVADRGYFKIEDIEACEKAGCTPHVPRPQRGSSVARASFARTSFATMSGATPMSARPGRRWRRSAMAGCAISPKSITAIEEPAAGAPCARDAPTTCAPFLASKTRLCSIAWPSA